VVAAAALFLDDALPILKRLGFVVVLLGQVDLSAQ